MDKVCGNGEATWDKAVQDASEEYKCRPVRLYLILFILILVSNSLLTQYIYIYIFPFSLKHNLCLDNCHSHVAMALNLMRYDNSTSWNMVNLCILSLIHGKHVR